MGQYSDLPALKKYMDVKEIVELTDDYNTGQIVIEIVDSKIAISDNTINGYLQGRYPINLTGSDIPLQLKDIGVKITAYELYKRRLALTLPDQIKDGYKTCIKTLEKIQAGKISPFPKSKEPVAVFCNKTSSDRVYNSTVLDQMP